VGNIKDQCARTYRLTPHNMVVYLCALHGIPPSSANLERESVLNDAKTYLNRTQQSAFWSSYYMHRRHWVKKLGLRPKHSLFSPLAFPYLRLPFPTLSFISVTSASLFFLVQS